MKSIPVFEPCTGIDTIKHLAEAFDVGWLGMGSFTREFEAGIEEYLSLKNRYVLATNTGTSALHVALVAAGVEPGDEVITPSFNYVADHQAVIAAGGRVVMCDIREDNLGMDCTSAESLISERTRALMPLHFAGIPCDITRVYELAGRYGLRVVEDGCHAFGTEYRGKKLGSFGDVCCFSFDPVKIITSIDGGAVVVGSDDEFARLKLLRFLGVDKETTERYRNRRAWDYDVVCHGYRYHLNNILASVGISQLKRVDEFIESRRKVCVRYHRAFSQVDCLILPDTDFSGISPFIYSIRVPEDSREDLVTHLNSLGIDVGVHFIPVHKHAFFSNSPRSDMTVTEKVCSQVLTLPLHSNMEEEAVERVIEGVRSYFF